MPSYRKLDPIKRPGDSRPFRRLNIRASYDRLLDSNHPCFFISNGPITLEVFFRLGTRTDHAKSHPCRAMSKDWYNAAVKGIGQK
ncbi:hypothetical protein AFLA_009195 [Aspergillus flavus NRRL3357]|nr:hypothetical protein AFLA_009195 [Aspergillus flavus NRRL3357]